MREKKEHISFSTKGRRDSNIIWPTIVWCFALSLFLCPIWFKIYDFVLLLYCIVWHCWAHFVYFLFGCCCRLLRFRSHKINTHTYGMMEWWNGIQVRMELLICGCWTWLFMALFVIQIFSKLFLWNFNILTVSQRFRGIFSICWC